MVVDTKYYDVLQIPTNADELSIKKVSHRCFLHFTLTLAGVPAAGHPGNSLLCLRSVYSC